MSITSMTYICLQQLNRNLFKSRILKKMPTSDHCDDINSPSLYRTRRLVDLDEAIDTPSQVSGGLWPETFYYFVLSVHRKRLSVSSVKAGHLKSMLLSVERYVSCYF